MNMMRFVTAAPKSVRPPPGPAVPASLAQKSIFPKNYTGMSINSPKWGTTKSSMVNLPAPRPSSEGDFTYNALRGRAMGVTGINVNGQAYSARAADAMPALDMPAPMKPVSALQMPSSRFAKSSPALTMNSNKGFNAMAELGMSIGIGAATGGVGSYATGGNFGQGAVMGGLAGGVGYGTMRKLGQAGVTGINVNGQAYSARAADAMPALDMPAPMKPVSALQMPSSRFAKSSPALTMNSNKGFNAMAELGMSIGIGAATGGVGSYATGGNFGQGAVMGGLAGGVGYGTMRKLGQAGVTGYSKQISNFMQGNENVAARRMAFGAGGMLAGGMFGGNRSHKRGFNARRGNGIGR